MIAALGRHIIADFYDCDRECLNNTEKIQYHMQKAAIISGAHIVTSSFHTFMPYGVSGAVIISESHLAIHTWPEYGYASVDLYTCGDHVDPEKAFEYLKYAFKSGKIEKEEHLRGNFEILGIKQSSLSENKKIEVKVC